MENLKEKNYLITLSCVLQPGDYGRGTYFLNGEPLTDEDLKESLSVESRSPTGFNHGYNGSGPSQLALCVCLKLFGRAATLIYQQFKHEVVSNLGGSSQETAFFEQIDMSKYAAIIEKKTEKVDLTPCEHLEEKVSLIEQKIEKKFGDVYLGKKGELHKIRYEYIEVEYYKQFPEEMGEKTRTLIEALKQAEQALILY